MADLVIGGRRHNPQRTVRAAMIMLALVLTAFVVAYFIYRRSVSYAVPDGTVPSVPVTFAQEAPGAPPDLTWGDASLSWRGGLAVLHAAGDPHAIGAAQGRLLGTSIPIVIAGFRPTIAGSVDDHGLIGGLTHDMRVQWRHRYLDDGIPPLEAAGLAGLVRGAAASGVAIDYAELLRLQAVLDVGAPVPWSAQAGARTVSRALTMVLPQAAPSMGRLWVAHELALPGLGDGGDAVAAHPVISIVHPEGGIAWAGVGWAGLVGAVTGINAEGLVVTVHAARTRDVRATRTARPIALLAREVLERAHSLDEAITLIEATPTLGAAAFVIVDGARGSWAVVERTPSKAVAIRAPTDPAVADVLTASSFVDDPENDRTRRQAPSSGRLRRALKLARSAPADVAGVAAILRDGRSADDAPLPYGHRGAIDDAAAVQAVIFDPAAMVMWVADGSAAARMRAFDLRHELRGEGAQAVPPADVLADGELDRAQVVRAARAELRGAREALRDGDRGRAAEWIARALVRAPTLPEARYIAGVIARARGDEDSARRWWRSWLEGGPDDPAAEEEVRAAVGM